jgi:hypothetical protein
MAPTAAVISRAEVSSNGNSQSVKIDRPMFSTLPTPPFAPEPLTAQHLDHRVGRVPADQHQHEQEQHHDRAGVDDDLHEAEERRLLDHVGHTEREHRQHQEQRRVHRVAREDHAERPEQRQRPEHPERDRLTGRHLVLDALREDQCRVHLAASLLGSG